jgi:hypothetical protein
MQTSIEEPEQRPAVEAENVATFPASMLRRAVMRFPADVLERCDRLAKSASVARGTSVSRAAVLRAVLADGLADAESDAAFASKMDGAILPRGRKSQRTAPAAVAVLKGST